MTLFKVIQGHHFRYQWKLESPYATSCVNNANLHAISHRFIDIMDYWCRQGGLLSTHSFGLNQWIQDCEILRQQTRNIALFYGVKVLDILNHIGVDHECDR